MSRFLDLTGQSHDYLTVVSLVENARGYRNARVWNVHCSNCGRTVAMSSQSFKKQKSCGCLRNDERKSYVRNPEFREFVRMLVFDEDLERAEREVSKRMDVKAVDEFGRTPLHWAAQYGQDARIIDFLVKHGADIEARQEYSLTPLMYAASFNSNLEILQALLDAGADVNATDCDGWTPLMWAAADQNNVDVLDALIAAGADTSVKDSRGATIMQVARSRAGENLKKQDAVIEFLTERQIA